MMANVVFSRPQREVCCFPLKELPIGMESLIEFSSALSALLQAKMPPF
jgi:hypothetical protein